MRVENLIHNFTFARKILVLHIDNIIFGRNIPNISPNDHTQELIPQKDNMSDGKVKNKKSEIK